jgi:hypothetical protein
MMFPELPRAGRHAWFGIRKPCRLLVGGIQSAQALRRNSASVTLLC